jgi:uncharacterized protein (TIGR00290 family)
VPERSKPKAVVSWSSGKDSAYALHEARRTGAFDIVGILTTVTAAFERVSMHGVRETLLERQAAELGLPCHKVRIPSPCPNEVYELKLGEAVWRAKAEGVSHFIFGDLYLEDIRRYRVERLERVGIAAEFPLWQRDTRALAEEMLAAGMRAVITCVDPRKLDKSWAGRAFDARFLADLPAGVDPCGENGEFHTFVTDGPLFGRPIAVRAGDIVERDGFVFADVLPVT